MEPVMLLLIVHLIGTIIAVGGATMSDALFFRSIKNRRISRDEYGLLHEAGKVIWGGLSLSILSGIGMVVLEYLAVGSVARLELGFFQLKLLLVGVVIVNGVVFHTRVLPFVKKHLREDMRERRFVKKYWLFALTGSISIVSWWSIVLLALISPALPFWYLLNVYLLVVVFAALLAYLIFAHQLFSTREIKEDYGVLPAVLKYVGVGLIVLVLAFAATQFSDERVVEGEVHEVCILESPPWFEPAVLDIEPGDTVVWEHCDQGEGEYGREDVVHTHPVEQIVGPEYFSSGFGLIGHGESSFNHTFSEVGANTYICPTHPYMVGVVSVGEEYDGSVWPKQSQVDPALIGAPEVPGVGEVWLDTQFHAVEGQRYPGSITLLNTQTWEIEEIITHENFNNPHNLWASSDEQFVFQTQWHADTISKIDVETREVVADATVGNAPAHLFVHPHKERLYVTMNNEDRVGVYDFDLNHLSDIETSLGAHGIWIGPDARYMSVAATLENKLDIVDLESENVVASFDAEGFPLGTQITHDGRYAMINLLLEGVTRFVDLETLEVVADVEVGKSPIWAMPGPRNEYVFVTNTGSADISVIGLDTLEVVKTLPAGAGAHGIYFAPNAAGGYYGYVSHKYEPYIGVVDLDLLETVAFIELDEALIGGNGILTLPNSVYVGWVS